MQWLPDHGEKRVSAGDLGHPAELAAVAGGLAQPQQGEVAAPALDALQAGLRHGLLRAAGAPVPVERVAAERSLGSGPPGVKVVILFDLYITYISSVKWMLVNIDLEPM